jgi:WD40 repeat protein
MRFAGGLTALLFGTAVAIVHLQIATALKPTEISPIAQQITVRIDGAGTGSGVIIERQGNTYTILTNWHVVQEPGSYTVYTANGRQYSFNNSQVQRLPGVDLATFQFTSNQNYRVAEKGKSESLPLGTPIHVAGFPQGSRSISFLSGTISSSVPNPRDGYAFIYTVNAFPDMSGGPILDEQGKLVGIHGRAITRPDTNATTVLGIPLNTYLRLASNILLPKPSTQAHINPPHTIYQNINTDFKLTNTLTGHTAQVRSVPISSNGKILVSSSGGARNQTDDNTIKIWNLENGKLIRTLTGHSDFVWSVAISPDVKTLASGSYDKTIKIWNLADGKLIRTLTGHSDAVTSIVISPNGKTLVSAGQDETIKVWNLADGKLIRTLTGHLDTISSLAISLDGRILVSASGGDNLKDYSIKIWNLSNGDLIRSFSNGSKGSKSIAISSDGKTLASSYDKTIKIWNLENGKLIRTLTGHSDTVWSVAISPDSKTLFSAGGRDDKTIKIWNLTDGKLVNTLRGHSDTVWCISISPDGKILVSGSFDKTIKIWQLSL